MRRDDVRLTPDPGTLAPVDCLESPSVQRAETQQRSEKTSSEAALISAPYLKLQCLRTV